MNGPINKSMELPSEFVSDFVSSVIAEVNRRVMKYDREIFVMDFYVVDGDTLVVETIDSEDSTYGGGVRISDLSPEAIERQQLRLTSIISAAYSELYLLGRGYGGRDIFMSKVKGYIDINKEKARHRKRIDETKRIKDNRIRKCKNDAYRWTRGGYYHETERVVDVLRSPNGRTIKTIPVSILRKGLPRWAKFLKTQAKRRYRKSGKNIDEESYTLRGNNYRKDYEVPWQIW